MDRGTDSLFVHARWATLAEIVWEGPLTWLEIIPKLTAPGS